MQISEIQMKLPFPDKIEMQFLECENKSKYTCLFDIFYPSDRIQIPVRNALERLLTDDDQRTEIFFENIAIRTLEVKWSYYFRTEGLLL